ncbi:MAG TPA: FAD-containing oxidoreductase [Alphaproteobacteria bacterium]|nr:FAD-containing oxidoreductase [Alphaproteobacteria bacterium]
MARQKDAIIIGAGQAGPFLAARLAGAGWTVGLIERASLGGTCINDGCTPTKTLIASARTAWLARRAADYGVHAGPVRVDMPAVKARKDGVVARAVQGLEDWLGGMDKVEIVRGTARFTGPHAVAVGSDELTAGHIFINTGCRPVVPDWPGLDRTPFLTNRSMMDLDVLPEHLVIVGGSYVGLEFAQMYRRFGARVTVVQRGPQLLTREDPDVADAVRDILVEEGIAFVFGASGFAVDGSAGDIRLSIERGGTTRTIAGSHLLLAIGRRPNVEDLNLDAAGIACERTGYIHVDERLRTTVEGVFALGDVNGRGAFTHTSYNDFEIVAANLLAGESRSVRDRIPASAVYTDPPLGRAGMSETEVRRSGRPALKATLPMTRVQRARERGETRGLLKLLVDAETQLVLGAAFLGIEGDEMIHAVIDMMAGKVPAPVIARTMHIHPTVSEYLPVLLHELRPLEASR